jgi:tetratricopeptide (TPR) repeat protein
LGSRRPTLQELIRRRQAGAFVGRNEQLTLFRETLGLSVDDPRRRFVFGIHGDAGVGKTYLVRQLVRVAREGSYRTAYVDEAWYDVVSVLEAMASELEKQGARFGRLRDRLATYRQRRRELDGDPGVPDGLSSVLTRSAVRVGLRAAGDIPFVGGFADELDADGLAEQADRLRAFLVRRFRSNSEDVELLLDPVSTLTPVFLQELCEAAEDSPVALFFDTYERTGGYLDAWLLALLDGRHGSVPADIVITISGQHPLDVNRWGDYLGIRADMPLEVFTETEARALLADRGVTDEQVIDVIIRLSGRLPLLVAMLAEARPESAELVGDPSGSAVERFLKWESDERKRTAALHGALPRRLDRDTFAVATGSHSPREDFDWLCRLPFVAEHADGFRCHDFVRAAMLRVLRRTAPSEWQERHEALADHYATERDALGSSGRAAWTDDRWQGLLLEEHYHRLCATTTRAFAAARAALVTAIAWDTDMIPPWAQALAQAGEQTGTERFSRLSTLLAAWPDGVPARLRLLSELANDRELAAPHRADAHAVRGELHLEQRDTDRALAAFDTALELNPDAYWIALGRARAHQLRGDYDAALRDLDRALEIEPDYLSALGERGSTYRMMGRYDDAITDLDRAVEIDPSHWGALAERGEAHRSAGHLDEALADLDRAAELRSDHAWILVLRGWTYRQMGRYDDAITDLSRAIELDADMTWVFGRRGEVHHLAGRPDEARADLDRAIELDPDDMWAIRNRGHVHCARGEYELSLRDLDRAVALDPADAHTIASRGYTLYRMNRFDESNADFTRAIELEPDFPWALASRGGNYWLTGRYEEALLDLDRAIALDPDYRWALTNRVEVYRSIGRHDDALADLDHLIELDPTDRSEIVDRARVHYQIGRCDDALTDFTRAIELGPTDPTPFADRSEVHVALGRYGEALADLTRAVELAPESARTFRHRSGVHLLSGDVNGALADITRAIELDPGSGWSLATRALVNRKLGRTEEAFADLRASLRVEPTSWAHYQLGIHLALADKDDDAASHLRQAIEMERGELTQNPAEDGETHLRIALCLLAYGDREGAHDSLREALAGTIPLHELRGALFDAADLHDVLGIDVADTVESIRRALDGPPESPVRHAPC